jgi:hypothetical protein
MAAILSFMAFKGRQETGFAAWIVGPDDFRPLAEKWRAMWPGFSRKNSSISGEPCAAAMG